MTDLVTWLRAQLDAEERRASGSGVVAWLTYRMPDGGMHYTTVASSTTDPAEHWVTDGHEATGWASARVIYDERQVRAEVAAKRAILDLFDELYEPALYEAVQHLALPYANEEGYQDAWRP